MKPCSDACLCYSQVDSNLIVAGLKPKRACSDDHIQAELIDRHTRALAVPHYDVLHGVILNVFGPHPALCGAALEMTMSLTHPSDGGAPSPVRRVTAQTLLDMKRSAQPISSLTAYDYPTARLVDQAGIDLILVGDSVGMAVLGYETTLPVTMEEMLHHTRAVARGVQRAFLVADMPFGSYHASTSEAIHNATRFIKEAAAQAVKIEGGQRRAELVRSITDAEIPVVAHIGLTPQSVHRMSGYRVQGKTTDAIDALYADALALEAAGAVAIVLEGIPREVAAEITARSAVPTIGIGAGPDCDGQILVFHDLFSLTFSAPAKFARRYADASAFFAAALERYRDDITARSFPSDSESYHLPRELREDHQTSSTVRGVGKALTCK